MIASLVIAAALAFVLVTHFSEKYNKMKQDTQARAQGFVDAAARTRYWTGE